MPVSVRIPTILRSYTGDSSKVEAEGSTLAEVLDSLESTYPGAKVHCVKFDVKDLDKVRALKLSATVSRARRPTSVSHSPLAPRPLTRF